MTIEKHSLLHEFPDHHHTIRHLKMHDRHFARLFDEYHGVDHDIHKFENGTEHTSDASLNALKSKRIHLKDELFAMVTAAESSL